MNKAELATLLQKVKGPIIEIAGPTPNGYELLNNLAIELNVKPMVTNISKEVIINPHSDHPTKHIVDEVVDVRQLPYDNNSIELILVSSLPYWEGSKEQAQLEYDNPGNPINNLHIFLYKEAARVLKLKGLLVQVNTRPEDEGAASYYSLKSIYELDGNDTTQVFMKLT